MSPESVELPVRINELEQKDSVGCDIVIQHVLPPMFEYDGNFSKNIIAVEIEASSIPRAWVEKINTADEAWTFSNLARKSMIDSGVKIPVKVLPHCWNTDTVSRSWEPLSFVNDFPGGFFFYTVADANSRKQIYLLMRAFHSEFHPSENAQLLVKMSSAGLNPAQLSQQINDMSTQVKTGLKLYPAIENYKRDILMCGTISFEDMMRLHKSCHAYVNTSWGECFETTTTVAMAMGNIAIVPNHSAYRDYIVDGVNGFLVDTNESDCFSAIESPQDLHASNQGCLQPNIKDLRRKMRYVYNNWASLDGVREKSMETGFSFGFEEVGNIIKEILS
jgi:glycosyltransferase involved in cell wall biosynthesis